MPGPTESVHVEGGGVGLGVGVGRGAGVGDGLGVGVASGLLQLHDTVVVAHVAQTIVMFPPYTLEFQFPYVAVHPEQP